MSNALRDQLLKAGLVNDKQAKKAAKEQRKEANQRHGQAQPQKAVEEAKRQVQQAQVEKAERDRQLNLQRQEAAEQKALSAQVRQLVETHRIQGTEGDIPFNFADGKTVKRLYVAASVRDRICNGQLAIVKTEGRYDLVARDIAEKIRARHAPCVILQNDPQESKEQRRSLCRF